MATLTEILTSKFGNSSKTIFSLVQVPLLSVATIPGHELSLRRRRATGECFLRQDWKLVATSSDQNRSADPFHPGSEPVQMRN